LVRKGEIKTDSGVWSWSWDVRKRVVGVFKVLAIVPQIGIRKIVAGHSYGWSYVWRRHFGRKELPLLVPQDKIANILTLRKKSGRRDYPERSQLA